MGNASLEGRQLSNSFCLTRFDAAVAKFQFAVLLQTMN